MALLGEGSTSLGAGFEVSKPRAFPTSPYLGSQQNPGAPSHHCSHHATCRLAFLPSWTHPSGTCETMETFPPISCLGHGVLS